MYIAGFQRCWTCKLTVLQILWIIPKLTILLSDKNNFFLFPSLSFCLIDHNSVIETSVKFFCFYCCGKVPQKRNRIKKSTIKDPKNEFLDDKVLRMTSMTHEMC